MDVRRNDMYILKAKHGVKDFNLIIMKLGSYSEGLSDSLEEDIIGGL